MGKVQLLGINIDTLKSAELSEKLIGVIKRNDKAIALNVNIYCMNLAYKNKWLKDMLNSAYVNFCDGEGVRLGAKILGQEIEEKITYNRWIWEFAELSEKKNINWYLIGSKEGTIIKAVNVLKNKYPNLVIKGFRDGYFKDSDDELQTVLDINKNRPNVLILGMGMPLQEKWLLKYWDKTQANIALTGGAVFDYISGEAKMTPDIFYKLKLEWFYRFLNEPKRLFYRYFAGNPLFFYRILLEKFRNQPTSHKAERR